MTHSSKNRCYIILTISALALCTGVTAQENQPRPAYDVVTPPSCTNNKKETVRYIGQTGGRRYIASGRAVRDENGDPVIFRSNYAAAPPVFQSFIDRHECAHHQTGDIDRPHPPRNSPEHLLNESIADCIAILRLRDEEAYDETGLKRLTAALRAEMAAIGFPEISISSRSRNIEGCFVKTGTAQEFINLILHQHGN